MLFIHPFMSSLRLLLILLLRGHTIDAVYLPRQAGRSEFEFPIRAIKSQKGLFVSKSNWVASDPNIDNKRQKTSTDRVLGLISSEKIPSTDLEELMVADQYPFYGISRVSFCAGKVRGASVWVFGRFRQQSPANEDPVSKGKEQ
ncbi:hypothetical protein K438DRAFT_1763166 [Mycena galopus ATCC 62051]|nr:hypothetical protein K438DRAFT_1763166 [Mycena galopus ATCC 62051]